MNKIKVGFSQAWFPMSMGMWFLRALQRREDVELWTTGPYTGNFIPWNYGMYLPEKYVVPPNLELPPSLFNAHPQYSLVRDKLPWKPDLFLLVDAGFSFQDRPDAEVVARVQTDPHVLQHYYTANKMAMDYDFSMQNNYMHSGEIYLPYAYDPTIYYPEDVKKEYDCCLIGLHYTHRDQLVQRLQKHGVSVHYSIGEVFDENRIAYNKAKIALSWSSLQDLPARAWEGLAMKLALVANRVPDMDLHFVDGRDYLGFNDLDEAERQVMILLGDDAKREKISEQGYNTVLPNTWDSRLDFIFKTCGLV
jgi:hypothetical protein